MNVLSLFDGVSCGQIALERAQVCYKNYFASEIKKPAIRVTRENFPGTIHVGDLRKFDFTGLPEIDLILAGSPCQDFSCANKNGQKGLDGEKSKLFLEFEGILRRLKPKYFLLENTRMSKAHKETIDDYMGVNGSMINSNLFSYQNRARYYWTNIPYDKNIIDKNISFQEFKDTDPDYCRQFKMNKTPSRVRMWNNGLGNNTQGSCANVTKSDKIYCLTTKQDRCPNSGLVECDDFGRYLTRRELELAQTMPVGYTDSVSYNQACDLLGDAWTVDVIAHILRGIHKAS